MDVYEKALEKHKQWKGKISIEPKEKIEDKTELTYAYTPGVARACTEIHKDEKLAYDLTIKQNTIAVVSDGTAVLGLGDIGAKAAMPVMEGKCLLFKEFGGVNAFPIVLDTKDTDEIINTIKNIAPGLGGINLEDISSPRCVMIENKLKELLDIPVFHDDQHGTAIVTVAALINALKIVKKNKEEIKVVVSGAGAAGYSITKLLLDFGVKDIVVCDSKGTINSEHLNANNFVKKEIAKITNKEDKKGSLKEVIENSDVFIGVSAADILDVCDVEKMNEDSIVFAMANPIPEISYEKAKEAKVRIYATGRSDYPNQINNVLAFPGIFKGVLEARASQITDEMKLSASYALADMISEEKLNEEYIIVSAFEEGVSEKVAQAVKKCIK